MSVTALPTGQVTGPPTGSMLGHLEQLPPGAVAAWRKNADGSMTEYIGKSISEVYPLVDPLLQSIISADEGSTWRPAAEIAALAWASSLLNTGTMIGKDGVFLVIYPVDTSDQILLKALRYAKITTEPLYFDNEQLYLDNSAVYIGATA